MVPDSHIARDHTSRGSGGGHSSNGAHPAKRHKLGMFDAMPYIWHEMMKCVLDAMEDGSRSELLRIVRALGGKPYPAYRDLQGPSVISHMPQYTLTSCRRMGAHGFDAIC